MDGVALHRKRAVKLRATPRALRLRGKNPHRNIHVPLQAKMAGEAHRYCGKPFSISSIAAQGIAAILQLR